MPCSAARQLAAGRPRDRRRHVGGDSGRDQRDRGAGAVPAPAQASVMAGDQAGPRRARGAAVVAAVHARQRRGPRVHATRAHLDAGLAGAAARPDVAGPLAGQRCRGEGGAGLVRTWSRPLPPGPPSTSATTCSRRCGWCSPARSCAPATAGCCVTAPASCSKRPAAGSTRPGSPGSGPTSTRPAGATPRIEGSAQPGRLDPAQQGRPGPRHHHRRLRRARRRAAGAPVPGGQQQAPVLRAADRDRRAARRRTADLRAARMTGQLTPAGLVAKYGLRDESMRELFTSYLAERAAELDYASLVRHGQHAMRQRSGGTWSSTTRASVSLHLDTEVAAAWKERLRQLRDHDGRRVGDRANVRSQLLTVRAFYLDIAQWAAEDPSRWAEDAHAVPRSGPANAPWTKSASTARPPWTSGPAPASRSCPHWSASPTRNARRPGPGSTRRCPPHPARWSRRDGDKLLRRNAVAGRIYVTDLATGRRTRPDLRRRTRLLGLGDHRGSQGHRHPHRGTGRAVSPQLRRLQAPQHRRGRPDAPDRPVQDRRRAAAAGLT